MTLPGYYTDINRNDWPVCPHCHGEMTGLMDADTEALAWECDHCQLVLIPEPESPHANPIVFD